MDKLKMQTVNKADENFKKLAEMFPNAVTETITGYDENGKAIVERAIDKDVLMQEISCEVVEGNEERYQFTWPDKKKSVLLANAPINKTLRPVRDDETTPTGADSEGKPYCSSGSVNFDNTENLYIEGDNLEVLKLLQETYLGKIKMIYIDPPYNTGNDFVYEDDFAQSTEDYLENSGQFDEDGNRLVKNLDSNGRFHTDWLNMIYPRLKLAKDLLSNDGVIFISIGQDEIENTLKICNDVFGKSNQLGIISRQMKSGGGTQGKYFAHNIDYVVIYAKQYDVPRYFRGEMSEELVTKVYNQVEKNGSRKGEHYRTMGLYQSSLGVRPSLRYYIKCPDGQFVIPPGTTFPDELVEGETVHPVSTDGVWRWSYELFSSELAKGNIEFKRTENGVLVDEKGAPAHWNIYTKIWLKDRQAEGTIPNDLLTKFENRHSAKEISALNIPFDFAKPVGMIKYLIFIMQQEKDIIVLDFFSGSATTAHAVMQLNAEDGGHRKFIMVQLPEETDEKSEAYKAGYKNICEIGKERIRRAAKKIAEENPEAKFDGGFRVLKCDSSNMKDVYYNPAEYEQSLFSRLEDNIKEDRTPEDLLFQVMLDLGVLLSSKIEETTIAGKKVFNVEDNYLIACFDDNVTEEVITEIAKQKPYYFVMRDRSMANDSVATNFEQIFATYSPDTVRKVL
ncbi:MAG: site-specific DNA-methyltransferase [Eubacterium sp.]|nr:site-specific DNA-methyltransferase [Eubacterium sp.]